MNKSIIKDSLFFLCFIFISHLTAQKRQNFNSDSKGISNSLGFELTKETRKSIERSGYARCLTDENEAALQRQFPKRQNATEFEKWLAPKIERLKTERLAGLSRRVVYDIPVVIHIIHDGDALGTGENITDAQALSQVQVMNEDFRRLMGTPGGANTTGLAEDVEINFCIAQQDESGNLTNGVVRHVIAPYSNNVADPAGQPDWETRADTETMKAATQWDPTKYLNMWTIRPGGLPIANGGQQGLLGYAQFPDNSGLAGINANGGAANTDGVVAAFDAMGTIAEDDGTFIMNPTYNLGRTMTHEVGHWLGLRHIWGDGDCTADDFCADTPNAGASNGGCPVIDTCPGSPGNDQVQNYMDYTNDACMDTFTQDQKDRMVTVMTVSPRRMELNSSNACNPAAPTVNVTSAVPLNLNEGSDCSYQEFTFDFSITSAGSASATASLVAAGTATSGGDYELLNNSITFATGATAPTGSNIVTLRVYNDSFVEGDETLTLSINVSTSGDAVANTTSFPINILDDDITITETTPIDIVSEDFEASPTGWTVMDEDGDGNNWVTGPATTGATHLSSNQLLSRSWINTTGALTPDNYIITNQVTIPSDFITLSLMYQVAPGTLDNSWFEEYYTIYWATDISSVAVITASPQVKPGGIIAQAVVNENLDMSTYIGQTGHLVIRHHNCVDEEYIAIDNLILRGTVATKIQSTISAANSSVNLSGAGTIYSADTTTSDLMLSITNNNTFDYGCTDVSVSRAGTDAQSYNSSTGANHVMDKTFTIAPTNATTSGNNDITFYFTDAEITGWETATGLSRNGLSALRTTNYETTGLTVGAFGANVTLTGNFTGLDGDFYFGHPDAFKVLVLPKVFLQGAALSPNVGEESLMRDDLRVKGLIPTTSPYVDGTTCNASVFSATGNDAIVDWILIELRDGTTNTTIISSKSGLLQRDGDIVEVDGTSAVQFNHPGKDYHIALKHRNHMGIMTGAVSALTSTASAVDLADATNANTFGTNAQSTFGLPTNVIGMWAGSTGTDVNLSYLGSNNDSNVIKDAVLAEPGNTSNSNLYAFDAYSDADTNMDGTIRYQGANNDVNIIKDVILSNVANTGSSPNLYIFTEQLPEN